MSGCVPRKCENNARTFEETQEEDYKSKKIKLHIRKLEEGRDQNCLVQSDLFLYIRAKFIQC